MKFPILKNSILKNIIIIVISLFLSSFFLLFGVANLIHPDVPDEYLIQNTIVCIIVCAIGVSFSLLAVAAFRGILNKKRIN